MIDKYKLRAKLKDFNNQSKYLKEHESYVKKMFNLEWQRLSTQQF